MSGGDKKRLKGGDKRQQRINALDELEKFRRNVPHVSKSALSAIIKRGKEYGLPELHERHHMQEATEAAMDTSTVYGNMYQTLDMQAAADGAKPLHLNVLNPLSFLLVLLTTCSSFSMYFEELHDKTPSSFDKPWGIALYSDEVTPGDAFSVRLSRKIQVVYWSFLQFEHRLSDEDMWITASAKRSSEVQKMAGGMSQVIGTIAKLFLAGDSSFPTTGVTFKTMSGRKLRVFAKLKMVIQDGGAHKSTWHCKGDAGVRFCMLCRNVFSEKSDLAGADDDGDGCCSLLTYDKLDIATSREIKESVQRVHDFKATDTADEFKEREIANGFTWAPYTLLLDPELGPHLRAAKQFAHDWMHCLFQSGVFNITLFLVLRSVKRLAKTDIYHHLHEYIKKWHWPKKWKVNKPEDYFAANKEKSNTDSKKFRCGASLGLSLAEVVLAFLQEALQSELRAAFMRAEMHIQAYAALVDLINCFVCLPHGTVGPEEILERAENFLNKFSRAFGVKCMTPKFHWLLHFSDQFHEFKRLVACFVHERKHRMVKRYCDNQLNTITFELSILSEVS